ncbi:MAG TPA: hypothetical protein VJ842_03655 [Pyrinomonadaceae bacterium]|nr:hypothetical protein [Pyrinomonadaceae bacterium]
MKKIASILLLSLIVVFSGCASSNTCNFTGLNPGATYVIVITDPSTNVSSTFQRVANSSGSISVTTSLNCSNVVAIPAINSNFALAASPSSVNLLSPPATVTVTGQSFDTTYGMPRVDYFDGNGYLVGGVYATSVGSGGTSLQANVPDLSGVYSGTYQVRVVNKTYSGYYVHTVGSATMTAWGRDRPDSDGDGWYDDQDCSPYDPYYTNNCGPAECGGYGTTPRYICDDMVY